MMVIYARRLSRPLQFEIGMTGVADPAVPSGCPKPVYLQSVEDLTRWYNSKLEEAIRMSPMQYWWLHRRWRNVPEAVKKRLAARQRN
jgi:hypothetical protein